MKDSGLGLKWKVGDLVWTKFGTSGRQPGQIITVGRFGTVFVLRYRVNSGRWTTRGARMAPSQILGRYDGPALEETRSGGRR